MKLHILSDLHLSRGVLPHPQTDADLVILAGDIARPAEALAWAAGFDKPVLYWRATTSSTAEASTARCAS
ncbi:hypothetical protein [Variovorax sp. MHTC-1]|uniref:hypothetical protein n=1 Tax=Variovorax sp. MHTC-1 TaxID=2495593 RepID=UPI00268465F3|nr:hypothetical protein [Variovorax sp. MHTC-1]